MERDNEWQKCARIALRSILMHSNESGCVRVQKKCTIALFFVLACAADVVGSACPRSALAVQPAGIQATDPVVVWQSKRSISLARDLVDAAATSSGILATSSVIAGAFGVQRTQRFAAALPECGRIPALCTKTQNFECPANSPYGLSALRLRGGKSPRMGAVRGPRTGGATAVSPPALEMPVFRYVPCEENDSRRSRGGGDHRNSKWRKDPRQQEEEEEEAAAAAAADENVDITQLMEIDEDKIAALLQRQQASAKSLRRKAARLKVLPNIIPPLYGRSLQTNRALS